MSNRSMKPDLIFQTFESKDIDHISQVIKQWDLELKKLNKGSAFFGQVDAIMARDFLVFKSDFSGLLEQKGTPPKGMRTIALPVDDSVQFYWRKQTITGNSLMVFPLGSELDAVTKAGFRVYAISISEDVLISRAFSLGVDWHSVSKANSRDMITLDPGTSLVLRNQLEQLFELRNYRFSMTEMSQIFEKLKDRFIDQLILDSFKKLKTYKSDPSNRLRIFNQFRDYIYEHQENSLISSEICALIGTSERSLQYAIKDFTGLTPSQYFKAIKLNMIRDELIRGESDEIKIKELAMQFGFWHSAQFATDYRNHFRELPSETLRRK